MKRQPKIGMYKSSLIEVKLIDDQKLGYGENFIKTCSIFCINKKISRAF